LSRRQEGAIEFGRPIQSIGIGHKGPTALPASTPTRVSPARMRQTGRGYKPHSTRRANAGVRWFARSTKDTLAIADRLKREGADLVSLSEQIDTTSAAGKMVFRMLAVLAEFERDLVSERTRMAMQHKKAKGERVGPLPFGFNLAADGVHLIENPQEQAALKHIARLRAGRHSLRAIAADLTRRGVPTKRGNSQWAHTAVAAIIEGQRKGRIGLEH